MKYPSSANLYTKTVNNTLFVLREMAAKHISEKMSGKVGDIIHDGWRSGGVHYPGVFAYYELKKLTMYQKLKSIAYQFHPYIFFK